MFLIPGYLGGNAMWNCGSDIDTSCHNNEMQMGNRGKVL